MRNAIADEDNQISMNEQMTFCCIIGVIYLYIY